MKQVLFGVLLCLTSLAFAQNASIEGTVVDNNQQALAEVVVTLTPGNLIKVTDEDGYYQFNNLAPGNYFIQIGESLDDVIQVTLSENESFVAQSYTPIGSQLENTFADLSVLEAGDESTSVSGLLTASRDVFLNKAGFQFGSDVFFNVRGYDSRYSDFMINGIRFSNPETGWQPFNLVGGLNDVLRYRETETIGANALTNGFGEIGGTRDYVLRPSEYGKGGRVTYSNLDRSYNHRVMGTYASGEKNGLSYVVSGSKRWADEGYVEGTYYDAYGAYAAVEGKVNDNHSVMVSAMAAPRRRGTTSIHRQEAYDIAGSNFYNADWGWQDGEKRNARLRKNYNPLLMVANYISLSDDTDLQLTGSYLTGFYSASRLERQGIGAVNPDPDYYRNLPSYQNQGNAAIFNYQKQIDWIGLYRANENSVDGRASYILEDNVRDDRQFQAAAQFDTRLDANTVLHYGANFEDYTGHFYKQVNDLLGAEYWKDVDDFDEVYRNNVDNPNLERKENDIFGHSYELHKRQYDAYVQGNFSYNQFDFFVSGMIGKADFWRNGLFNNEKFEDESKGESEKTDFLLYGGKAGTTYKIDGRNYISANGMYYLAPPQMNTLYLSPTTRAAVNERTEGETIYGGDINFNHKSPTLKLRLSGYGTRFDGQAESILAYQASGVQANDNIDSNFGNYFTNGIDKLHYGGELGFDYNINPSLAVSGAASLGKYIFMSRPIVTGYDDTNVEAIFPANSSFLLDFYEDNTPQTAVNLGLTYRGPKRFILNVDGNFYNDAYAGPSALRRTVPVAEQFASVQGLTDEESLKYWTKQERLPEAYRLNLSLYKEIRFSYSKQIGVNVSVNNVLDSQDYPNLAFEDLRVQQGDGGINPSDFPTRYRYAPGRTYFVNVAYKFR